MLVYLIIFIPLTHLGVKKYQQIHVLGGGIAHTHFAKMVDQRATFFWLKPVFDLTFWELAMHKTQKNHFMQGEI